MHTRNRFFRSASVMLSTAIFVLMFSACGGSVVKPNGISVDAASPSPSPKTAAEVFAEGASQALMDAVNKSERLGSAQLDLLINPGAQVDDTQSNYTKSTIAFTDPQDPQGNLALSLESFLDASTGDSSVITSVQMGSETAKSGGIYFTGNTMLIKKANTEQPMIQHTLDPTVASSYKSLSAIERFLRVLSNTSEPKLSDEEWKASIDAYLQTVTGGASETDYVSEQQDVTVAGTTQNCTATTLALTGEPAVAAARGLACLIAQDSSFKSMFVSQYMIAEDTYGVTGIDGVLRDIDALTPEEKAAMTVTFKTLQGDKTSAVYLSAVTGQKAMSILFKFFKDGNVRENDIVFSGFDGGGVKLTEQNVSAGGDNYTASLVYEQTAPGGAIQERSELTSNSTITEISYQTNAQFKYSRAPSGGMDALEYSGTVDYSQQKTAQGAAGQSTGTFVSVNEGETTNLNLSTTLEQSNAAAPVTVPQFLPAAGVSAADQASLFAALGEDFDGAQFNLAPASVKTLAALLVVFF